MGGTTETSTNTDRLVVRTGDEHGAIRTSLIEAATALRELREATAHLDVCVDELRGRLSELDRWVTDHFAFEENDGLFELIRRSLPERESEVDRLAGEHADMRATLERARVALDDTVSPELGSIIGALNHFTELLARHESVEENLMKELREGK